MKLVSLPLPKAATQPLSPFPPLLTTRSVPADAKGLPRPPHQMRPGTGYGSRLSHPPSALVWAPWAWNLAAWSISCDWLMVELPWTCLTKASELVAWMEITFLKTMFYWLHAVHAAIGFDPWCGLVPSGWLLHRRDGIGQCEKFP